MRTTWDESKRAANIAKHGVDFAALAAAFDGLMLVDLDTRTDYGEDRMRAICAIGLRILFIVYVEDGSGTIRIISARRANANEKSRYLKAIRYLG